MIRLPNRRSSWCDSHLFLICINFVGMPSSTRLADPHKPVKREVLIDIGDLQRTTGQVIAEAIKENLERHKIRITDCKGQACDTTASMSSVKKGVQAEISKLAPDSNNQGCCLHKLNLVICHACKILSIVNMTDSCRELFSFFDSSPKRQKFFEVVIHSLSPDSKVKLKRTCARQRGWKDV